LKKALQDATAEAARRDAELRERAAREQRERDLFALSVGPVLPLRRRVHSLVERPRPHPLPRQRERDEAAVLVESISDEFDVESLLETDDALSFRRRDIGPEVVRKLRRGVWAIQAQLDLHGLRRDAAREQLGAFLRDADRHGLRCVRVIHGKGNGSPGRAPVLKSKVKGWLVQKSEVIAFTQARASDGGHGALLVLLRPAKKKASRTA
jgi:DNA-nicking Smr family endonuclease